MCTNDNKMPYSIDLHRANDIYNCAAVPPIQVKCVPMYHQNHVNMWTWSMCHFYLVCITFRNFSYMLAGQTSLSFLRTKGGFSKVVIKLWKYGQDYWHVFEGLGTCFDIFAERCAKKFHSGGTWGTEMTWLAHSCLCSGLRITHLLTQPFCLAKRAVP